MFRWPNLRLPAGRLAELSSTNRWFGQDADKTQYSLAGMQLGSQTNHLSIPAGDHKLGERAFSVAGPRAWNQLPTELKTTTNTATFKRKLKTFLFSIAYL